MAASETAPTTGAEAAVAGTAGDHAALPAATAAAPASEPASSAGRFRPEEPNAACGTMKRRCVYGIRRWLLYVWPCPCGWILYLYSIHEEFLPRSALYALIYKHTLLLRPPVKARVLRSGRAPRRPCQHSHVVAVRQKHARRATWRRQVATSGALLQGCAAAATSCAPSGAVAWRGLGHDGRTAQHLDRRRHRHRPHA